MTGLGNHTVRSLTFFRRSYGKATPPETLILLFPKMILLSRLLNYILVQRFDRRSLAFFVETNRHPSIGLESL
jgi:hypothetical protein